MCIFLYKDRWIDTYIHIYIHIHTHIKLPNLLTVRFTYFLIEVVRSLLAFVDWYRFLCIQIIKSGQSSHTKSLQLPPQVSV